MTGGSCLKYGIERGHAPNLCVSIDLSTRNTASPVAVPSYRSCLNSIDIVPYCGRLFDMEYCR